MSEKARQRIAENLETKNLHLDLAHCGLTDLNDLPELGKCVYLTNLNLSHNKITDIFFLKGLTSLTDLDLNNNYRITDISSLQGLTALTHLDLSLNPIRDISFLKSLTSLTHLYLAGNRIRDISFLIWCH